MTDWGVCAFYIRVRGTPSLFTGVPCCDIGVLFLENEEERKKPSSFFSCVIVFCLHIWMVRACSFGEKVPYSRRKKRRGGQVSYYH